MLNINYLINYMFTSGYYRWQGCTMEYISSHKWDTFGLCLKVSHYGKPLDAHAE